MADSAETIPPDLTTERPAVSLGHESYDMRVNATAGQLLQEALFGRLPPTVSLHTLSYNSAIRLVIEILETP